jgi:hypothetical protein
MLMSLTFEVQGQTSCMWPLTPSCLSHIDQILQGDSRQALEMIFGDEQSESGTWRLVSRTALVEAVKVALIEARKLPRGFSLVVPPFLPGMQTTVTSGGVSGLLIDGKYHALDCVDDYWTFQTIDDLREAKEPIRRFEPAKIQTENLGLFAVIPKKSRSGLSKLLSEVQRFLQADASDEIRIIWG